MKDETLTGSTDSNGLFTAKNQHSECNSWSDEFCSTDVNCSCYMKAEIEKLYPPLFCYNENNELVKGVEGLEVKKGFRIEHTKGWSLITDSEYEFYENTNAKLQPCYIAVQPTEKAVEYTYTIDGKPYTEKQYHDTEYASNFIDVGHSEKHATPLPEAQPLDGVKTAEDCTNIYCENGNVQIGDGVWQKCSVCNSGIQKSNSIKSASDWLEQMCDVMPYTLPPVARPYILEAMQEYAEAYHAQFATDAGGGKELLIKCAEYGYNYRANTSFPKMSFDENCLNNFLQFISNITAPSTHSSSEMVDGNKP